MAKVIAYGTGRYGYFDLFMDSCHQHDIDPILLGWGKPWVGSGKKLSDIRDYLVSLPANEIVVSVDPFDVVFLSGLEEIIEKYQASGAAFLCGAIKLDGFLKRIYEIEFNRSGIETQVSVSGIDYLNAGTWVSTAGYAAGLIDDLERHHLMKPTDIDQQFLTDIFLREQYHLDIDRECNLFQNIIFRNFISRVPDLNNIIFEGNRISNLITGTYPSILHVSANTQMGNIAKKLGFDCSLIRPIKSRQLFAHKAVFYFRRLLEYTVFR